MEQPTVSLQADFLDVRHAYAELAAGKRMAALCWVFTAFTLAQAVLIADKTRLMGIAWAIPELLLLLASLLSCAGLWLLHIGGKKGALRHNAFTLTGALPCLGTAVTVLLCIAMGAVLIVVVFSNAMVPQGIAQLQAQLSGTYYRFTVATLSRLVSAPMTLIILLSSAVYAGLVLLAVRCALLTSLIGKLRRTQIGGMPPRLRTGYVCGASYVLGVIVALLGGCTLFYNPSAGACCVLLGASLFLGGLMARAATRETDFLYTYYDKLNKSLKRQAAALRENAAPQPPLAIPAPAAVPEVEEDPVNEPPEVIHMPPTKEDGPADETESIPPPPDAAETDTAPVEAQ